MRRSLTLKLTLAFLVVSLIGVTLVAVLSRAIQEREFDRLMLEQSRSRFAEDVSTYYQLYGSWNGIDQAFRQRHPLPPSFNSSAEDKMSFFVSRWLRFGLADGQGIVVISDGPYQVGDTVPAEMLAQGTLLKLDDQVIGIIFLTNDHPPLNPLEQQYLIRTYRALVIAAAVAVIVALLLGGVLARTLTRTLRELTIATQAMAKGELEQSVPVRSQDELGQLAESFNQMSSDLSRATRLRRQMTADIAHDLRTPLTVITGYIEALRNGDLQPTPTRFDAMYDEAQHLKRLVQDLRTLSLADAGELSLNCRPVSVPELLDRVATAYRHQAGQQQINLAVHSAEGLPDLEIDFDRMVQVLGNLVSNALRYTPKGGQIVLSAHAQNDAVLLQVQDTGNGIPPDELPHIFNRFYRADKSRQQSEGESGLGLAIARAIVQAHGGSILAESEVGQGTTFQITLPLVRKM
jgi:signal transduction histidine kinase